MSGLDYIDNLWALDRIQNPAVDDLDTQKKQFAFKICKEDFSVCQGRENSKKSDLKDAVSDIYQLIGFYSVFQGVWFQGVTQLAPQTSCRASILPIILSVLVSTATIIGVHLKLARVFDLKKGFSRDKLDSKIRETRIFEFEVKGLSFDLATLDDNPREDPKRGKPSQKILFEKELERLHQTRLCLLAFLTALSTLFAWLIYAIMCDKFP